MPALLLVIRDRGPMAREYGNGENYGEASGARPPSIGFKHSVSPIYLSYGTNDVNLNRLAAVNSLCDALRLGLAKQDEQAGFSGEVVQASRNRGASNRCSAAR
jgi:hypothetical protein